MVALAEDLFLLATEASNGRPLIDTTHLDLGLGGALLVDLMLQQRVALHDSRVAVTDPRPTGDALLDRALSDIIATRSHEPGLWVRHLTHGVRRAVQDRLVEAGVLRRDDHKVLGIIPTAAPTRPTAACTTNSRTTCTMPSSRVTVPRGRRPPWRRWRSPWGWTGTSSRAPIAAR